MQIDRDKQKEIHKEGKVLLLQTEWKTLNQLFRKGLGSRYFLKMTAQCSGEVKWEVRNVAGKGTARDIVLAVSVPCMVQLSSFQKWGGTDKDKNKGEGWPKASVQRYSRWELFSWEKILLKKQMRELLKITKEVGTLTGNYFHCLTDTEITKHH